MLLEFRTENYKTFREAAVFSMQPVPGQKGLEYSLLKEKIGKKIYKGLSSAVIYGPNAAGKTNILSAMDTLRNIVLRGNIRNGGPAAKSGAGSLGLIPCNTSPEPAPIRFGISFINRKIRFDYSLGIDVGKFMAREYKRKITEEKLSVNGEMIFSRGETLEFGNLREIRPYWMKALGKNMKAVIAIAESNPQREELFLTNGFKSMFSSELTGIMTEWFEKKLMIIDRPDSVQPVKKYAEPRQQSEYTNKTLGEAAKVFGIRANELGYLVPEGASEAGLYSLLECGSEKAALSAESYESRGTIKFISEFPLVISALKNGAVLAVDEFDTSIHPMALMNIIGMFHNDDINKNNAQLIFNTHNPVFLNKNLYRRDEIKFIERDDETHQSVHYSLSDFGAGTRKGEDYMNKYFISRYGAIRDIDFSPLFDEEEKTEKTGETEDDGESGVGEKGGEKS